MTAQKPSVKPPKTRAAAKAQGTKKIVGSSLVKRVGQDWLKLCSVFSTR